MPGRAPRSHQIGIYTFNAQVQFWNFRKTRQVYPRINTGAARRGQRRRIIISKRIRVYRQPITNKRQLVRKIEAAGALTRIAPRRLVDRTGYADIASPNGSYGEWPPHAANFHGPA